MRIFYQDSKSKQIALGEGGQWVALWKQFSMGCTVLLLSWDKERYTILPLLLLIALPLQRGYNRMKVTFCTRRRKCPWLSLCCFMCSTSKWIQPGFPVLSLVSCSITMAMAALLPLQLGYYHHDIWKKSNSGIWLYYCCCHNYGKSKREMAVASLISSLLL